MNSNSQPNVDVLRSFLYKAFLQRLRKARACVQMKGAAQRARSDGGGPDDDDVQAEDLLRPGVEVSGFAQGRRAQPPDRV